MATVWSYRRILCRKLMLNLYLIMFWILFRPNHKSQNYLPTSNNAATFISTLDFPPASVETVEHQPLKDTKAVVVVVVV